jgi:hypothetical protein
MRLPVATIRTYDALKARPGANPRHSDARDAGLLRSVEERLRQLVGEYRIGGQESGGAVYVFWSEVEQEIKAGAFDDLLPRL